MIETGQRVGELVVVRELERPERTHGCYDEVGTAGREWLCRCDCGRPAVRTTSQLNAAVRSGALPCCQQCLDELRAGQWESRRRGRLEMFRGCWEREQSLYPVSELARLERDIRRDMAELMGFEPEPAPPRLPIRYDPYNPPNPWGRETFARPAPAPKRQQSPAPTPTNQRRSIESWVRWQSAVDGALESWAQGAPRVYVEKLLWRRFRGGDVIKEQERTAR